MGLVIAKDKTVFTLDREIRESGRDNQTSLAGRLKGGPRVTEAGVESGEGG